MKKSYFIHGALTYWAINSLHQDILGKQEYINRISSHWIDGSITIPIAMGVIFFVTLDYILHRNT